MTINVIPQAKGFPYRRRAITSSSVSGLKSGANQLSSAAGVNSRKEPGAKHAQDKELQLPE